MVKSQVVQAVPTEHVFGGFPTEAEEAEAQLMRESVMRAIAVASQLPEAP